MNLLKFNAEKKFRLLINLRSMAGQAMHGKGTSLENTTDGIQLEIERKVEGSGTVNAMSSSSRIPSSTSWTDS